jgi:Xaa-Pro aminopeptidase
LIVFGLKGRERYEGYLSNESIDGVVVFPASGEPIYLTWTHHRVSRRLTETMRDVTFWIDDVRVGLFGPLLVNVITELKLQESRVGVVGLDSKAPSEMEGLIAYRTWEAVLKGLPSVEFVEMTVPFSMMMLVKSEEELALIRFASLIGEKACQVMLDVTRPGVREADIFAAVMEVIHSHSAVSVAPHLIMSVGADDVGWAPPYWNYAGGRSRLVRPGDLVQAEIFPCYGGVETQMQMSVAVEPVPSILHELNDVARRSYEAGLSMAKPGVRFQALAEAMAEPVRQAGCWTLTPMVHSVTPVCLVGHIGINIDQAPIISGYRGVRTLPPLNDRVLEAGIPIAFEPNACRGLHRVNIGGTVVVQDGAPLELNRIPVHMHVVR